MTRRGQAALAQEATETAVNLLALADDLRLACWDRGPGTWDQVLSHTHIFPSIRRIQTLSMWAI